MMKKLKPIPDFKTEDEEFEFWSSVDNIFDYLDPDKFVLKDPPMVPKTLSFSAPADMELEVKRLSKEQKVEVGEMVRQLVAAGLKQQGLQPSI
jgi:hypothetical protein